MKSYSVIIYQRCGKDASRWKTGDKWRSFGWNVIEIDGHRVEQISDAIRRANQTKGLPSIIISRNNQR